MGSTAGCTLVTLPPAGTTQATPAAAVAAAASPHKRHRHSGHDHVHIRHSRHADLFDNNELAWVGGLLELASDVVQKPDSSPKGTPTSAYDSLNSSPATGSTPGELSPDAPIPADWVKANPKRHAHRRQQRAAARQHSTVTEPWLTTDNTPAQHQQQQQQGAQADTGADDNDSSSSKNVPQQQGQGQQKKQQVPTVPSPASIPDKAQKQLQKSMSGSNATEDVDYEVVEVDVYAEDEQEGEGEEEEGEEEEGELREQQQQQQQQEKQQARKTQPPKRAVSQKPAARARMTVKPPDSQRISDSDRAAASEESPEQRQQLGRHRVLARTLNKPSTVHPPANDVEQTVQPTTPQPQPQPQPVLQPQPQLQPQPREISVPRGVMTPPHITDANRGSADNTAPKLPNAVLPLPVTPTPLPAVQKALPPLPAVPTIPTVPAAPAPQPARPVQSLPVQHIPQAQLIPAPGPEPGYMVVLPSPEPSILAAPGAALVPRAGALAGPVTPSQPAVGAGLPGAQGLPGMQATQGSISKPVALPGYGGFGGYGWYSNYAGGYGSTGIKGTGDAGSTGTTVTGGAISKGSTDQAVDSKTGSTGGQTKAGSGDSKDKPNTNLDQEKDTFSKNFYSDSWADSRLDGNSVNSGAGAGPSTGQERKFGDYYDDAPAPAVTGWPTIPQLPGGEGGMDDVVAPASKLRMLRTL